MHSYSTVSGNWLQINPMPLIAYYLGLRLRGAQRRVNDDVASDIHSCQLTPNVRALDWKRTK